MFLRTLALALLLVTPLVSVGDTSDHWILVRSPHFTVATNAGEKQGRRIAAQFERVRSLFHAALPELDTDTPPIAVLAVKDERDFRTLEPEEYLAKESLRLSGLFLQIADKNYVLLRLDAEGDHPYSTIYHEYSHFLMRKSADWMPLWLSEGLAEFYENTEIHEKDASLGEASAGNQGSPRISAGACGRSEEMVRAGGTTGFSKLSRALLLCRHVDDWERRSIATGTGRDQPAGGDQAEPVVRARIRQAGHPFDGATKES